MKLFPIYSLGIKAFCSDMIIDTENEGVIYFMSLCGYQATVKGLVANFLEYHGISIEIYGEEYYLTRNSLGYKVQMKKLPSGLSHAIVFPELALPKRDETNQNRILIIVNQHENLLNLFYRHLDEKTDIPLHPSWSQWLWNMFEYQENWIHELTTLAGNYRGYCFNFSSNRLYDLISSALQRNLPDVIGCLEKKGIRHG